MRKSLFFIALLYVVMTMCAVFAEGKVPVMIVTPFLESVTVAPNSSADIEVVVQNNATVNQTITDIQPLIPAGSLVTATMLSDNCGFLNPGDNCNFLVRINSLDQLGSDSLNVAVCSFNGTLCSKIRQPVEVINNELVDLFVFPTDPSVAVGSSLQFAAIGLYADDNIQDITNDVTWTSSDTSKATVSNVSGSKGLASGIAAGSSDINATLGLVSGTSTLTVTGATLTSITVIPVNPSLISGESRQFYAVGIYSDNTHQNITDSVTWSSSDTSKATISNTSGSKGRATGVGAGAATITATLGAISGSTTLTVTAATLTSISVTPTNPRAAKGTTVQFAATGTYSNNTTKDITDEVTWTTASTQIAIVSNQAATKGLGLGVGRGRTNVIATLGGVSGFTRFRVTKEVLSSIDVTPKNDGISVGETLQYTATGIYTDHSTRDLTKNVTWKSSDKKTASISKRLTTRGLAKGRKAGSVTITAKKGQITGTTTLSVSAVTLTSIAVTPTTPTIANGRQQQFTATGTYSDASTQDLTKVATWTSSNTGVAIVSNVNGSRGLASSVGVGASTISAIFSGVTGNTALTVTAATLTSIAVTPANSSIPVNTTEQFTATGTYSDLSTKNITAEATWSSTSTSIAEISNASGSNGLATGIAQGATTIQAMLDSITGTTPLTVITVNIGDNLDGGVVACLNGGMNDLIAATADNSTGIVWGGSGTITNAQSDVNGTTNTSTIVSTLGAGTTYAAGVCDAYEIDSAGNTPCVGGNTCYNDWFLPATNQLACLKTNKTAVGGFNQVFYWSSTEYATIPNFSAWFMSFASSGTTPSAGNKIDPHAVRCVRLMNNV